LGHCPVEKYIKPAAYAFLFRQEETFLAMRESQGQPPRLEEILDLALQLCSVLSYLHRRQPPIIYRDLKPSNIMRTQEGSLVLIDFGIARHYRPGQVRDTQRLGSPGYAAPEQYGRAQTTPQSDIYSLGALLSFLLSGQDPAEDALPLRRLAPRSQDHVDERAEMEVLVQRMRSPDPSRRPQSCQEIASELEAIKQRLIVQESTWVFRPPTPQLQEPQSASAVGQQHIQQPERQGHLVWSQTTPRLNRRTMLIGLGMLIRVVAGTVVGIGIDKWNVGTIVSDPISTFQGQGNMIAMAWSADGNVSPPSLRTPWCGCGMPPLAVRSLPTRWKRQAPGIWRRGPLMAKHLSSPLKMLRK